jgi:hypothetical protein
VCSLCGELHVHLHRASLLRFLGTGNDSVGLKGGVLSEEQRRKCVWAPHMYQPFQSWGSTAEQILKYHLEEAERCNWQ